jgi:hypothetical protein
MFFPRCFHSIFFPFYYVVFILRYYSLSQRCCWNRRSSEMLTLLSTFRKNIMPLSSKGQALQVELDCLDLEPIGNTFVRNVGTFTPWQCLIQEDRNSSFSYFVSSSIHFFVLSPVQFSYLYLLYCAVFTFYFCFSLFSILICPFCFTHLMQFPLSSRLFHCTVFFSPTTSTWFCLNLEPPDVCLHICTKSPAICSGLASVRIEPCSSKERNSFSEFLLFVFNWNLMHNGLIYKKCGARVTGDTSVEMRIIVI